MARWLTNPVGAAVAALSLAGAAALALVPALAAWSDRWLWVALWGGAIYGATLLVAGWPARAAAAPAPRGPYPDGLTHRQVEVLRLIAAGKTGKEIAAALVVSAKTADRHTADVYRKIGARNRAEATAYAIRHGLYIVSPKPANLHSSRDAVTSTRP